MGKPVKHSNVSNIIRFKLKKADDGQGLTGIVFGSSGLIISTMCDNEPSPTVYTAAGSTIETIATLGTYAAPTATKCRFKEVDATNNPGVYEFQFANARFAVANARNMIVSVSGFANLLESDYEIEILQVDLQDSVKAGLSELNGVNGIMSGIQTDLSNGVDGLGALKALLDTIAGYIDTEIATLLSDVTEILTDTGTTLNAKIDAVQAVTDVIPDSGALTTLLGQIIAIKAVTDNMPETLKKNTVRPNLHFMMVDANGNGLADLTVTAQRALDGASEFEPMDNAAVSIAYGLYRINLSQADSNGNSVSYRFSAAGAKDSTLTFFTVA